MTIRHESYMATESDMSGSRSKNRFRVELLWGIEKLLECLDQQIENFSVVFDYLCDIELHLDGGYEFYQIKTSDAKSFGVSWICRRGKNKSAPIIAKLYDLHDVAGDGMVRLVVVGNKRFVRKGGSFEKPGELLFSTLHEEDKRTIETAIAEFHTGAKPDLSKLSYLLVAMDLARPDDSVRGHLIDTYRRVMQCEPRKPYALYEALRGLAIEKACEEQKQVTYEQVISNKSITSDDIDHLFEVYADRENSQLDFVMSWINRQPPLKRNRLKCAYQEVVDNLLRPRGRMPKEKGIEIVTELENDELTEDAIISYVAERIEPFCQIEVTNNMREIYAAIALYEAIETGIR